MPATLSLALIMRNEAANLPALFATLEPLKCLMQKVVVDTGSQDGSSQVARSLGAEVSDFVWCDDFAAARNAALAKCRGDFILWLDADDRLPILTAQRIQECMREKTAWRWIVRSPREDGTGDVFRQIRLFPNHYGLQFEGRIHEQLGTSCTQAGMPIKDSDLEVLHTGYATSAMRLIKAKRNLTLLHREAEEHPRDETVAMALGNALCQADQLIEAKKIFLDWIGDAHWSKPPADMALRRFPCLLSEVCFKLGEIEEAERWDRLAMAWEPQHLLPGLRIAKREMQQGRVVEALRLFLELTTQPTEVGILASDNASARRNALGFATLLDVHQNGFEKADDANRCLTALLEEGDPLPLDPLFPLEFFEKRNDAAALCNFAESRIQRHPEEIALKEAYQQYQARASKPNFFALQKQFGKIAAPLLTTHRAGLSVVMIVKNEAKNIREAIESFKPIADEIIVNDTGSTDGTQQILTELGVHWFQSEWKNDFSQARNEALSKATFRWVIWLDADDRIPEVEVENFHKLKLAPLDRAFGFQVINTQGGQALGGRFMQVRMFPNHPSLRFRYKVHEQIVHAIATLGLHCFYTETTIHHLGYEDAALKKTKAQRNLDILMQETDRLREEPSLAMSVGDSYFILGEWEKGIEAYLRAMEIPHCQEINADVFAELPACVGRGWQKLGQREEALRWFKRSRELQPQKIEPAFYEAECLMEMGQNQDAESAFSRVAEMPLVFSATTSQFDTTRIFSLWHLSELKLKRGDEKEAFYTLQRLTKEYPQVLEAWHSLGKLYSKRGEKKEALHCFDNALALNPAAIESLHRDRLTLLHEIGKESEYLLAVDLAQKFFPASTSLASIKKGKRLSLCLIVKNEMSNLPACLESTLGLADETIVVDTGSTDGTAEWAERFGAKVLRNTWENDFSRARNHSIDAATGQWILWLDADDRLLPEDKAAIRTLVQEADPSYAYGFAVQNSGDGGKTGTMFNQIRLFPNRPDLRFVSPIHEQILPAIEKAGLRVTYLPIRIVHTGYADPLTGKAKQIRNRALLELQIQENNHITSVTHYTLGMACLDLQDPKAAMQHFSNALTLSLTTQTNPHIVAIIPVKKAIAFAQLNRHDEALQELDGAPHSSSLLPEAKLVRAQLLQTLGRIEEARVIFEQLLEVQPESTFIPMDFSFLKIQALRFLGEYWHTKNRGELAIILLKAGLKIKEGIDFSRKDLLHVYSTDRVSHKHVFV